MRFKEAVSRRILELCETYNYTPNGLAEAACIPPTTLQDLINCKVNNPSSSVIYKICITLKISLKEFFDSELFDFKNISE